MGFSVDHEKADMGELIPAGTYEMIVRNARLNTTRASGKEYISVLFVVRNDVEQPQKNRAFFHSLWRRTDPTPADEACEGFSAGQINALSKALKIKNGRHYKDLTDWMNDLDNRVCVVTVEHREYSGRTYANARRLEPSARVPHAHTWPEPKPAAAPAAAVNDEDWFTFDSTLDSEELPF
jgi:hypothetical protein